MRATPPGRCRFSRVPRSSLVNPKAWIFALGAVTTFRLTGLEPLAGAIVAPLVMAAVIVPSASLWAAFGDGIGRLLTGAPGAPDRRTG